ncbi:MAG: diaminopimelate decarboxylase [Salibacteraceae bacterium]
MKVLKQWAELETPFYAYDRQVLHHALQRAKTAAEKRNYHVHYALKANAEANLLQSIVEMGFGADCVSGQEVECAVESGFAAEKIVFAGVGKSDREIRYALENDIYCFNCESLQELEVIDQLAASMGKVARVALRINPDVDPNTHRYITTGLEENKFGINVWQLEETLARLQTLNALQLEGLHFHIGSQITDLSAFRNLCTRVNEIQRWFFDRQIVPNHVNLGGGLGIDYDRPAASDDPDFEAYFSIFERFLEPRPHQSIHFELGRALVGHCGALISKVLYVKPGIKTDFVILDAGMTELIRPALYQAYHRIENLSKSGQPIAPKKYDVVGPICESSDCFGKAVELPQTERGDWVAIHTAGAYGQVMASRYNLRPFVPAVWTD